MTARQGGGADANSRSAGQDAIMPAWAADRNQVRRSFQPRLTITWIAFLLKPACTRSAAVTTPANRPVSEKLADFMVNTVTPAIDTAAVSAVFQDLPPLCDLFAGRVVRIWGIHPRSDRGKCVAGRRGYCAAWR